MNKLIDSQLILASKSPRRKDLLKKIGLTFKVKSSKVYEDFNIKLLPADFVSHYAKMKAESVSKVNPNCYVIGADTIVVCNDKILGKPNDKNDSYRMLSSLSGKTHKVYTGVSIQHNNHKIDKTFYDVTDVSINTLTNNDICYYIDNYKLFDKAGSYGIQGFFAVHINKINGCFYNVMGLPLSSLYYHFSRIVK
jgi:septum formation protein